MVYICIYMYMVYICIYGILHLYKKLRIKSYKSTTNQFILSKKLVEVLKKLVACTHECENQKIN